MFPSHFSNWQLSRLVEENSSIWQRLWNFIETWGFIYFWVNDYIPEEQEIAEKYLGNDVPYLIDILKNMSVFLVNESPILAFPRPEQPNAIFFSGIHIQETPPPLSKVCNL